jgi:ectonucleotide pyrophosphatase/phosphodiesterase family protein 5
MAEIREDRIVELDQFLERELYDMYGSSPVWNILPKPGHEQKVLQILRNNSASHHFTVYDKEHVPEEYHYRNSRRILSLIVVSDEGWDIIDKKANLGNFSLKVWGNHGYNNSLPSMRPLFLARGPAFKKGFVHNQTFFNIDLYPMMCFILEMFPLDRFPSNGTLTRVFDMIDSHLRPVPISVRSLVPVLLVFGCITGSLVLMGICFVVCASCGKSSSRKAELRWDPGVTDFDLEAHPVPVSIRFKHGSDGERPLTGSLSSERVLLLEEEPEEDI